MTKKSSCTLASFSLVLKHSKEIDKLLFIDVKPIPNFTKTNGMCVSIKLDDVYTGQFKYEMGIMRKQHKMGQWGIKKILSFFVPHSFWWRLFINHSNLFINHSKTLQSNNVSLMSSSTCSSIDQMHAESVLLYLLIYGDRQWEGFKHVLEGLECWHYLGCPGVSFILHGQWLKF